MKTIIKLAAFLSVLTVSTSLTNNLSAQGYDEKNWSLSAKDTIIIEYYSGSRFNITTGDSKNINIGLKNCNDSNFGAVTLDFNGNPIEGSFEFIARADKGKIVCPYKFDTEQVFKSKKMIYKNEADFKELVDYKVCSFIRGDQKPKVLLKTVTGKVKVIG